MERIKIIYKAEPGEHLFRCMKEALKVSIETECKIEILHNEISYEIDYDDLWCHIVKKQNKIKGFK